MEVFAQFNGSRAADYIQMAVPVHPEDNILWLAGGPWDLFMHILLQHAIAHVTIAF